MKLRIGALVVLGGFLLFGAGIHRTEAQPKPADLAKAKRALGELQDFIGVWNLEGLQKDGGKTVAWKETIAWGWKFKGDEAWITVKFADGKGKYYTHGDLKYNVPTKKYELTLTNSAKAEEKFVGDFKVGTLKLESTNAKTGDVTRLQLETLANGVRMQLKVEKQEGGKGPFEDAFTMAGNKDGESIAGVAKKKECIVTGGAASIAVTYKGETYYVCCSGCADAFKENPEKFVKK